MTIRKKFTICGWTRPGLPVRMEFSPAPAGTGIVLNSELRADIRHARVKNHTTVLIRNRCRVSLVEHLLAACAGMGITDLQLTIDRDELPFNDGSSLLFARQLKNAGITGRTEPFYLATPVAVAGTRSLIIALPAPHLKISCLIDYPQTGPQFFSTVITPERFLREIAPARTFGPADPALKPLLDRLPFRVKMVDGWLFPAEPRFRAEPCRHKILDLLGDLALFGRPLRAELFAYNPGHRLNLKLVRQLRKEAV
ncbi:MAG: UDP-3-O-acyl-N-acetylglucosamine deacetylase [candidate division WOR-3 bacterium]|nr:UDP-3-O-acyl-N-acetylglucosamine deacetylase [candidate division WOR-3 bacterium]